MQRTNLPSHDYDRFHRLGIFVVLLAGLCRAWIGRFSLDADGIAYLDLSDAFRRHDWQGFLNAYWSPLYPMLLAVGRTILPASKAGELIAAHIVNFLIYVAAVAGFEFFYQGLRRSIVAALTDPDGFVRVPEWALW